MSPSASLELTYAEAGRLALEQEMERDHRVWALGQDVGPEGGMAGQYKGLQEKFGKERIVDTPISENMMMACAVGAAISGTRPVVEMRFADLALCATDELVNQAAKIRYMFDGQARVPLVARQAMGLRNGVAAQHSQSTEALWVHIPGLVVVTPSTPASNHGLLKAAIRSDDPVVYMEHKGLWGMKGAVDPDAAPATLGKAEIVRPGSDVTIVAWSAMRGTAIAAADALAKDGISAEVIDLLTIWPWDRDAVLTSVAKTGRLVVAHESVRAGGFGAEIAAEVAEVLWDKLKAPVKRLGSPRAPVPYSIPLEDALKVTPEHVTAAARSIMG